MRRMKSSQELGFWYVVGVVLQMVAADCQRMRLKSTSQDQASGQCINVVHAYHDRWEAAGERGHASFQLQDIVNARARKRRRTEAQVSQIADGRRSRANCRLEDIFDI